MKPFFFVLALVFTFLGIACQKCQDCTLTKTYKNANGTTQTTTTVNEYCGKTLDDIDANKNYTKNDVVYKWSCE